MSSASSLVAPAATQARKKRDTRQLIRKIQACKSNVARALELLGEHSVEEDGPYLAALHVCGKAKHHSAAMDLYYNKCPCPASESCRALAIAVCGKCGAYKEALEVLYHQPPSNSNDTSSANNKAPSPLSVQSYNAAVAACGHASAYNEALRVLENMPPNLVSTFTCNAVLTAFLKSRRGMEALQLFQRLKKKASSSWPNATPDRNTYHLTIHALVKQGNLPAAQTVFHEMKQHPDTFPKDATFDVLITGYGKRKNWDCARALEQERQAVLTDSGNDNCDSATLNSTGAIVGSSAAFEFWDMPSITKVGRGKYARWEFGTLVRSCHDNNDDDDKNYNNVHKQEHLTIAVHPHCNPGKNGMSLLLLRDGIKFGYVIMINSATVNTSTLLGVYVDPEQRKHGYSKVLLALWLKLCLEANIDMRTGIIHKPLLALVLQHTFGCTPQAGAAGGVEAEVSAGVAPDKIVLYSTSAKNLEGAFSPRDVKREGIEFSTTPAEPRGRKVRIGCAFEFPVDNKAALLETTNAVLADKEGNGKVSHRLTAYEVRRILLGEK